MLHRLFIAVPIPNRLAQKLHQRSRHAAERQGWKITPPKNLHVTLLFLGDVNEVQHTSLQSELVTLQQFQTFQLKLDRIALFEDAKSGILAALPSDDSDIEALTTLHNHCKEIVSRLSIPTRSRHTFRPHVTLARRRNAALAADFPPQDLEALLPVNEINLYQSQLVGEHPQYHVLSSYPLKTF